MTAPVPAAERLPSLDALDTLEISAAEVVRARQWAIRYGMSRDLTVDLSDPVITWVERATAGADRPAVTDATRVLSYAELGRAARRLATLLEREGVGPGQVVAVGGERCATVIVAFLALELLGALYLPISAGWPAARVRDVLDQAGAAVLVTVDSGQSAPALLDGAAGAGTRVVYAKAASGCPPWPGAPRLPSPDQPRYVLFTSGSTGRPKGAVIEHRGMLNHLHTKIVDLEISAADVVAQTAPLGFDISIWQMLCPLLVGGRVDVIADEVAADPVALVRAVDAQDITVVELVPTLVRQLLDHLSEPGAPRGALTGLRWMIATGEELPADLARRWLATRPRTRLLNAYGPAECADDVTQHTITADDVELLRLPIGTPIINTRLYVLRQVDGARGDEQDGSGAAAARWVVCEAGETGELFVGGFGVGRGYVGDQERTRDAFYRDPFSDLPTGRLYRTGDAVTLLAGPDHQGRPTLQYLGRVDRQVKISGVRMELGEIEAVLRRHPAVAAAAVVVHTYPA